MRIEMKERYINSSLDFHHGRRSKMGLSLTSSGGAILFLSLSLFSSPSRSRSPCLSNPTSIGLIIIWHNCQLFLNPYILSMNPLHHPPPLRPFQEIRSHALSSALHRNAGAIVAAVIFVYRYRTWGRSTRCPVTKALAYAESLLS